jgi:hypothetical protein
VSELDGAVVGAGWSAAVVVGAVAAGAVVGCAG